MGSGPLGHENANDGSAEVDQCGNEQHGLEPVKVRQPSTERRPNDGHHGENGLGDAIDPGTVFFSRLFRNESAETGADQ